MKSKQYKRYYFLRIFRIVKYGIKYLIVKDDKYKFEVQHNYYTKGFWR